MNVTIPGKKIEKKRKFTVEYHHKYEVDFDDWVLTYGHEYDDLIEAFNAKPTEEKLVKLLTQFVKDNPYEDRGTTLFDFYWSTIGCKIETLAENCNIVYPEGYTGIRSGNA